MTTTDLIKRLADALERSNNRLKTFGVRDSNQTMRISIDVLAEARAYLEASAQSASTLTEDSTVKAQKSSLNSAVAYLERENGDG